MQTRSIEYFDHHDICKYVEAGCKFENDLWYYWSSHEVTPQAISIFYPEFLIETLQFHEEYDLAQSLKEFNSEYNKDDDGVYVGYFW